MFGRKDRRVMCGRGCEIQGRRRVRLTVSYAISLLTAHVTSLSSLSSGLSLVGIQVSHSTPVTEPFLNHQRVETYPEHRPRSFPSSEALPAYPPSTDPAASASN